MNICNFNRNRIWCRISAALLCAALLCVSANAMPEKVLAAQGDGLVYGTQVDNYMQGDSDPGTIEVGGNASGGSSASSGSGTSISIQEPDTVSIVTDSESSEKTEITEKTDSSVAIDHSSEVSIVTESPEETTVSTGSSGSLSTGLYYGNKQVDLFGTGSSSSGGITIEGGTIASFSSYTDKDSDFNKIYTALEIYVYLRQQGFSAASACGVLGNIKRESGCDPTALNESSGSYGLFQCLGSLKERQEEYCAANGLQVSDAMAQVKCMILDIAPDLFTAYGKNYNHITYQQFMQMTDPQAAAEAWRAVVERNNYSAKDVTARKQFALSYYGQWSNYDGSGFEIIEEALKYVGNPYVWGGNSLTTGIDCSHYVCAVLRNTGHYDGEYRTSLGLRTTGTEVPNLSQAQPGDVLCWNGHVALYITNGYYVNAASKKLGICIGSGDIANKLGGLITIRRIR